jgi:chain length determinant protein tyrosine kinase EpsG
MAKFLDSDPIETLPPAAPPAQAPAPEPDDAAHDRSIGDILAETRNLTAAQVERVLAYQREKGVRFGEAAIALRMASSDDVLYALAQQFNYPYAPEASSQLAAEVVALSQPFSPQAEAFRALRSQVMMRVFAPGQATTRALALISPDSGDGKSYVAANLAVVLAQLGGRTLLIDADMRNPRQHDIFKLTVKSGLSGALSGRAEKQAVQQVPGIPSLFVLPVGAIPPNPLELVERPAFGLLVRELSTKFDHVLVDTPAASLGSDGQVIAARCGAALGLARRNASRVKALKLLSESIAQTPAELVGFIVNEH